MKTPDWWYEKPVKTAPWWRPVLWPLSQIWAWGMAAKMKAKNPYRAKLWVISVGNLTMGGSGKSPLCRALAEVAKERGLKVAILSRGHGGHMRGPIQVDPKIHTAHDVGDEPLMLARDLAVFVARDRVAGLKALEAENYQVAILDDAHQNPAMIKDVSIVAVDADIKDGHFALGDGGIFPYGPLRERLKAGLNRADLVIFWKPHQGCDIDPNLQALLSEKPQISAYLTTDPMPQSVVAFAGIAKPWKFEETLKNSGYEVCDFKAFGDHEPISEAHLDALLATAKAQNAALITTEKDWVRLNEKWRERVDFLPIRAVFSEPLSDTLFG